MNASRIKQRQFHVKVRFGSTLVDVQSYVTSSFDALQDGTIAVNVSRSVQLIVMFKGLFGVLMIM